MTLASIALTLESSNDPSESGDEASRWLDQARQSFAWDVERIHPVFKRFDPFWRCADVAARWPAVARGSGRGAGAFVDAMGGGTPLRRDAGRGWGGRWMGWEEPRNSWLFCHT